MPPRAGSSKTEFRGTGPFRPPRPTGRPAGSSSSSSAAAAATSKRIEISDDDDDDDDGHNDIDELERSRVSNAARRSTGNNHNVAAAAADDDAGVETEVATDNDDDIAAAAAKPAQPAIPPALLSRLLSHFFQNEKGTQTRLTQDAHAAIDKYMEIFIREAVARSVAARTDEAFLDVDVLQKVAGQLIMDM